MSLRASIRREDNIRIGPISVITLIIVVCMAVLAVLAASTAHATNVISERQAGATTALYCNERAAQEMVAGIDGVLAESRANGASSAVASAAVESALDGICEKAREAGEGKVDVVAYADGGVVNAEFTCDNTRKLIATITIRDDATYRIDKWKMLAVQDDSPSGGRLWTGE